MLTTALVILLSYLLSKTSLRLTFELKEGCLLVFIIIVILLILSNIVKGILTPGKTLEEYKKDWDEPEICIARVVYITTVTALFTYLLSLISEPETSYPFCNKYFAKPLIPTPPIAIK